MPMHWPRDDDNENRMVAALAVAVLGLDLIAKGTDPDPQQGAATVLRFLRERYDVTPKHT
jgi:hypothetical protein